MHRSVFALADVNHVRLLHVARVTVFMMHVLSSFRFHHTITFVSASASLALFWFCVIGVVFFAVVSRHR